MYGNGRGMYGNEEGHAGKDVQGADGRDVYAWHAGGVLCIIVGLVCTCVCEGYEHGVRCRVDGTLGARKGSLRSGNPHLFSDINLN